MVDYAISELQWRREVVVEGRGKRITKTKKKKKIDMWFQFLLLLFVFYHLFFVQLSSILFKSIYSFPLYLHNLQINVVFVNIKCQFVVFLFFFNLFIF